MHTGSPGLTIRTSFDVHVIVHATTVNSRLMNCLEACGGQEHLLWRDKKRDPKLYHPTRSSGPGCLRNLGSESGQKAVNTTTSGGLGEGSEGGKEGVLRHFISCYNAVSVVWGTFFTWCTINHCSCSSDASKWNSNKFLKALYNLELPSLCRLWHARSWHRTNRECMPPEPLWEGNRREQCVGGSAEVTWLLVSKAPVKGKGVA